MAQAKAWGRDDGEALVKGRAAGDGGGGPQRAGEEVERMGACPGAAMRGKEAAGDEKRGL